MILRGKAAACASLALALAASACSVLRLGREAEALSRQPVIHGVVRPEGWGGRPLVVILSGDKEGDARHSVKYLVLHDPGPFYFYVAPGTYRLAAFEDRSRGPQWQPGDPVLVRAEPIVARDARSRIEVDLAGAFSADTPLPARFDISEDSEETSLSLAHRNVGRVLPLSAPEMSLDVGQAGLWRPADYQETVRAGIFLLEPFDPKKIPVLFVHGIGGAPVQFETIVERLDRECYQPWFFAYPSIFPLPILASALNTGMDILRRKYAFDRVNVIAHSMGGLVSRAYLNEYLWSRHDYRVGLFVSLASPFGGNTGAGAYPSKDRAESGPFAAWMARSGLEDGDRQHLAWTDLAPDSVFLRELYSEPLPKDLPYHLVFAFLPQASLGPPGDGTVSLTSQLRTEAQREASGQRGFAMGHDEVLVAPAAVDHVFEILARTAPCG